MKLYYFLIYKPYGVLSQFKDEDGNPGLGSAFKLPKHIYPVGRLDMESEGLLILTNDKSLNNKLLNPNQAHKRTYLVEVDGTPDSDAMKKLEAGIEINIKGSKYHTLPAEVRNIEIPPLEVRKPDINRIKHAETSWIELKLIEGKNRQVRKMTAAVGHPTLRLVRVAIEDLKLGDMKPGEITQISPGVLFRKLKIKA